MIQHLPGLRAAAALVFVSTCCCGGCQRTTTAEGSAVAKPRLEAAALSQDQQPVGPEPCNDIPRHFLWEDPDLDGDGYGDSYSYDGPPGIQERVGHTIHLPWSKVSIWSNDSVYYADEGMDSCDMKIVRRNDDGTTEYAWEYPYDWLDLAAGSSSMPVTILFFSSDPWESDGTVIALQDALLAPGHDGLSGTVSLPTAVAQHGAGLVREVDSVTMLRMLTGRVPEYALQVTRYEYEYDDEVDVSYPYTHYSMPYDASVLRKEMTKLKPGRYRFEFVLGGVEPTSYVVTLYDSRGWAVGQKRQEVPNSFSRMRGQVETVGEAYYMRVSHNYEPGG